MGGWGWGVGRPVVIGMGGDEPGFKAWSALDSWAAAVLGRSTNSGGSRDCPGLLFPVVVMDETTKCVR